MGSVEQAIDMTAIAGISFAGIAIGKVVAEKQEKIVLRKKYKEIREAERYLNEVEEQEEELEY